MPANGSIGVKVVNLRPIVNRPPQDKNRPCTTRPENLCILRRNCRAGLQPAADFQSACRGAAHLVRLSSRGLVAAMLLCGADHRFVWSAFAALAARAPAKARATQGSQNCVSTLENVLAGVPTR